MKQQQHSTNNIGNNNNNNKVEENKTDGSQRECQRKHQLNKMTVCHYWTSQQQLNYTQNAPEQ